MADDFRSLTRPPEIPINAQQLAPANALYINRDDTLLLQTTSFAVSQTFELNGRILRPDGQIVPFQEQVIITAPQILVTKTMPLIEGWLLSVAIRATATPIPQGSVYMVASILRGITSGTGKAMQLFADYITASHSPCFPGGRIAPPLISPGNIRSITGTNPAAGAEISETVGSLRRWRLLAFRASLVTDATVANRNVTLLIDDGANIVLGSGANFSQVASTTRLYNAGAHGSIGDTLNSTVMIPLPPDLILPAAARIRTSTFNIQAADDWGAPQYLIEEWPDV